MIVQFDFKNWTAGKHWAINLLLYIKKLFHLEQMFSLHDNEEVVPLNKEAYADYLHHFPDFVQKCKLCVMKSQDNKYKNPAESML